MKQKTIALIYDVDGTLVPGDIPNYKLIPAFKQTPQEFWEKCQNFSRETECDDILAYFRIAMVEAQKNGISLNKQFLNDCGKGTPTFEGLDTWFARINEFGGKLGVNVEHYIISAGIGEMVETASFAPSMKKIFASEFIYDGNGNAVWPKRIINHTAKTQYLFRISKGLLQATNSQDVNERLECKPVPFNQMIFLGDGLTDIPAMTIVQERGGASLAVYNPSSMKKKELARQLMYEGRVSAAIPADYSEGKMLEKFVKSAITRMASAKKDE